MSKKLGLFAVIFSLIALAACGTGGTDGADGTDETDLDELEILDAKLQVTEEVDVDKAVDINVDVTYGDEDVDDAEEVVFEVWEEGKQDDSEMIDATNNEDGSYSAETSFDHDGLFHIQAHTTARGMHTMPVKEVTVGDGGDYDETVDGDIDFQTEGFDMMFMEPEDISTDDEVKLMTHITMDDEPLSDVNVRYEIWNYDESNQHHWEDAKETSDGDYEATHTFENEGNYTIQVHVEDDDNLHEHKEYQVDVK